jgi:hypothetical protein
VMQQIIALEDGITPEGYLELKRLLWKIDRLLGA